VRSEIFSLAFEPRFLILRRRNEFPSQYFKILPAL
jgi:hypothetical protein